MMGISSTYLEYASILACFFNYNENITDIEYVLSSFNDTTPSLNFTWNGNKKIS